MAEGKFNAEAAWNDALALLRANREVAGAIAGIFLFLPTLCFNMLGTPMNMDALMDPARRLATIDAYLQANWLWLLVMSLSSWIAALAIFVHVTDANHPTVGEALVIGLRLLPFYFIAQLLSGLAIFAGANLLLLPGLYLMIRWAPLATVVAAERITNPIDALRRAWRLTKGHSLRFGLFIIFIFVMTYILQAIFTVLLSLPLLLLPHAYGAPATVVMSTFAQSVATLFLLFVLLASYRQLVALQPISGKPA